MKHVLQYPAFAGLLLGLISNLALPVSVQAQDKISPRIDVAYYQADSALRYLLVTARKRIERRFEPVENAELLVSIELAEGSAEAGKVITNAKGEGKIILSNALVATMNDLEEYAFTVEFSGTDSLEEASESITIKPSRLKIETYDADSTIRISLQAKTNGKWEPFEGADVVFFVKRQFGKILIGEEYYTTDEDGAVELTFETDIPGDVNGVITIHGIIEDHEEFGNMLAASTPSWGVPLHISDGFNKRSLWGTRDKPPWWLLVFPNLIIAGVWGVIVYLVALLLKIKRLSRKNPDVKTPKAI